ncbi:hypothetical protein Hdeb2414_s0012g00385621 [Helianthus debilis subsp. tardiflorus]
MDEELASSNINKHMETDLHGLKHGRLTSQKEVRKQARTRTLHVSEFLKLTS